MLSGKLRHAIRRLTEHEVVGCLLTEDVCKNTVRIVVYILREKPWDEGPLYRGPTVLRLQGVQWGTIICGSQLIGWKCHIGGIENLWWHWVTGIWWHLDKSLDTEVWMQLRGSLRRCFQSTGMACRILPLWAAYQVLMSFLLVAMDKCTGVLPMVIGDTLSRELTELILKLAGNQSTFSCGNM